MQISLTILGNPIAKARPRFVRMGKFVKTYNIQDTEEGKFKWEILRGVLPHRTGEGALFPSNIPIKIITIFYMKRPKNHYGTGKNSEKLKITSQFCHLSKPDLDNLNKMVYDCCNQIVWVDDSQVCEAYSRKEYSGNPRTEIIISERSITFSS